MNTPSSRFSSGNSCAMTLHICRARSMVGTTMTPDRVCERVRAPVSSTLPFLNRAWSIGSKKARVLPEPVSELRTTSRPCSNISRDWHTDQTTTRHARGMMSSTILISQTHSPPHTDMTYTLGAPAACLPGFAVETAAQTHGVPGAAAALDASQSGRRTHPHRKMLHRPRKCRVTLRGRPSMRHKGMNWRRTRTCVEGEWHDTR